MLFSKLVIPLCALATLGFAQDDDVVMPLPGDLKNGATTPMGKTIAGIIQGSIAGQNNTKGPVPTIAQRKTLKCGAWYNVTDALNTKFVTNGACNDFARAAIRAGFHDAGTWSANLSAKGTDNGGADGSLFLYKEYTRGENKGLQDISVYLGNLATTNNVTIADMFQYASAHATVSCKLGPRMRTFVGRINATKASPLNLLPDHRDSAANLTRLFQDKNISPEDLAALLGAHSTSKQFNTNVTLAGQPQDSTPEVWDVKLYGEVLNGPKPNGVFQLDSDVRLAKYGPVNQEWVKFVNDQHHWNEDYARAFTRLSLLGVNNINKGLIECTDALPAANYASGQEGVPQLDEKRRRKAKAKRDARIQRSS